MDRNVFLSFLFVHISFFGSSSFGIHSFTIILDIGMYWVLTLACKAMRLRCSQFILVLFVAGANVSTTSKTFALDTEWKLVRFVFFCHRWAVGWYRKSICRQNKSHSTKSPHTKHHFCHLKTIIIIMWYWFSSGPIHSAVDVVLNMSRDAEKNFFN